MREMFSKAIKFIAAAVVSGITGALALVIFGVLLPVWLMILIYGRQQVEDAPAHGGIILFITVPVVGLLVLLGVVPLGAVIYQKLLR